MAPGMLPMPPRTAAVKAFRPGMKPVYGLIRLYCTPNNTPAAPPIAPPMRNVSEMIRLTSIPMRLAAAGQHAAQHHAQEHERPRQRLEEARALQAEEDLDAHEGADDEDLGVREVDELEHAVDHRVAQRDERVHETEQEAVEQDLRKDPDEEFEVHGTVGGGAPVDHPATPPQRRLTSSSPGRRWRVASLPCCRSTSRGCRC